jgi:hypothetical protein
MCWRCGRDAGDADQARINFGWVGKRTATHDFATVVHRIKLLGFNAVRLQFV